ncbi:hypothetical protein KC332_g11499 [Hortaea werneckii]|uniref:BTB domain-containing protein n=1 Tax=Hortaea werneckii EXF-2000 TaxID=1157616 RepID=A0A1Z5TNI3_HORWE|nr:hypothetical protein KC341_g11159 [Hortaea werneckii]KAI7397209.1 hypothetical protein KC332_g11499 [Hortaea werneckii]OTA37576.1 hypothetical protein BTJ68_02847 [Hortaea werneckii EXF-2000]
MSLPSRPSPRPLAPVAFRVLMESLADDEMVNIVLDRDGTVKIQRTLLLNLSPWFKTALTRGFMEGQSLKLRFPGFPSNVVQTFVYWIFHARLWMFAEEHLLPDLQRAAMSALSEQQTHTLPAVELLLEVYKGTALDSPLRKAMANAAASGYTRRPNLSQIAYGYPRSDLDRVCAVPGFAADFATAIEGQVAQAHLSDDERDACLWRLRGA